MKRIDEYEKRRAHLKDLSDEELYERFWKLAEDMVEPMLDLGQKYTTPFHRKKRAVKDGIFQPGSKANSRRRNKTLSYGQGLRAHRLAAG